MILHYDREGAETLVSSADPNNSSGDPMMARLESGGFVLAWRDQPYLQGQTSPYDVRLQIFDSAGAPVGASFLVSTSSAFQSEPALTGLSGGGFALAWQEYVLDSGGGVRIQIFDAAGNPVGAPISINSVDGIDPTITQLADGSLAVTWISDEPTPDVYAVRVQRFSVAGAPLGDPVTVSTQGVYSFAEPVIAALESGGFVVTWTYSKGAPTYSHTVAARVFDSAGDAVGASFDVSGSQPYDEDLSQQAVALAGGGFVLIWTHEPPFSFEGSIRGRIYADDGTPLGAEFVVNDDIGSQLVPRATALASGGFAVSWNSWDGAGRTVEADAIVVQVFDAAGQKVGTEFRADAAAAGSDQSLSAIVEYGSGDIAVAYTSNSDIKLQRFGESAGDGVADILLSTLTVKEGSVGALDVVTIQAPGGAVNAPVELSLLEDSSGAFALVDGALVITDPRKLDFETEPTVELTIRAVDASGIAFDKTFTINVANQTELPGAFVAGEEFRANTATVSYQHHAQAAKLAGGDYIVLWYSAAGSQSVVGQLFDSAGAKMGGELVLATGAIRPSVSALGDGFVATWVTEAGNVQTVHGRRYDGDGAPLGNAFVVAQTPSAGFGMNPRVESLAGGGFVVALSAAWGADSSNDVLFRCFTAAGVAAGPLTVANSATTGAQTLSGITALGGGGFLLVWTDSDADGTGVMARRFGADGTPVGAAFSAKASAAGYQNSGVAAAQADGSFAIVWIDTDQYDDDPVLKLQRFDSAGARIGSEVVLSAAGNWEWLGQPTIEAQPGGGYVVSWARDLNWPGISNTEIVAQRVGPDGALVGGLFQVNSTVYRAQQNPAIAADGTGGFLIAWDDQSQLDLGSETDVRARIFTDVTPLALALDDLFETDEATALAGLSVFANNGSGADGAPASGSLQVIAINGSAAAVGQAIELASGALVTLQANGTFAYDPNGAFGFLADPSTGHQSVATDRFTYTLAGGSTATVTVAIDGLGGVDFTGGGGPDQLRGTSAGDRLDGGAGNDRLLLQDGGDDSGLGGDGNDVLYFGAALSPGDVADGGNGRDAIVLQGNVTVTLSDTNLVGIESISIQSGANATFGDTANNFYDFDITTADGNVAAGQQLIVNAQSLRAGEDFTFDGSAETDGRFLVYGGHGVDDLTGGDGVDVFLFEGQRWGAGDKVDGGAGRDALVISAGNGLTRIEFGADSLTGIESISLNNRYATDPSQKPSYDLVLHNGNVAAGATLIVNGSSIPAGQLIKVDGRPVLDGNLILFGSGGNDTLSGGGGTDLIVGGGRSDSMAGRGGADIFRYDAVTDSTAASWDLIGDFQVGIDKIDLSRIDANTHAAGDQAFHWIGANAFSGAGAASAGELRVYADGGRWWAAGDIDGNGVADLVIALTPQGAILPGQEDFLA